jgi:hypothetical protein
MALRAERMRQVSESPTHTAKKEVIWCMTLREDAQVAGFITDSVVAKRPSRDFFVTEPVDARVLVICVKTSAANPCPSSVREARGD